MNSRKYENRIMAKFNEIAQIIRKAGHIRFGILCREAHIAPATLHQYWKAMRDLYDDLDCQGGDFFVKEEKHHRLPDGKLVPLEK